MQIHTNNIWIIELDQWWWTSQRVTWIKKEIAYLFLQHSFSYVLEKISDPQRTTRKSSGASQENFGLLQKHLWTYDSLSLHIFVCLFVFLAYRPHRWCTEFQVEVFLRIKSASFAGNRWAGPASTAPLPREKSEKRTGNMPELVRLCCIGWVCIWYQWVSFMFIRYYYY